MDLEQQRGTPWWVAVPAGAIAGGMGWGIRGQYGHETGAMMAGLLMGLVAVLLYLPYSRSLRAARAAALCALGISLGGSMTYGQTVGLTHDAPLIGNWDALRWGMIGLFLKGGIWIGFGGVFLGMGLSSTRYRPHELALLLIVLVFATFLGIWLFNTPFDPEQKLLPRWYFSDDWRWEPDGEVKPRVEVWGGLLTCLLILWCYAGLARRDRLVRRMGMIGFLAGGVGFACGQCVQAYHAWNPEQFAAEWIAGVAPYINWWNMMEITFGAIAGGGLLLGVWWNRSQIAAADVSDEVELPAPAEWALAAAYLSILSAAEFIVFPPLTPFIAHFLVVALIPFVAVTAGRIWPYLVVFPFIALPIAGKTLRQLHFREEVYSLETGIGLLMALPLIIALLAALLLARKALVPGSARNFARIALLLTSWLYFWLNFAFFHFPWPWEEWTGRTPSGLIFAVCLAGMTFIALAARSPARTGED